MTWESLLVALKEVLGLPEQLVPTLERAIGNGGGGPMLALAVVGIERLHKSIDSRMGTGMPLSQPHQAGFHVGSNRARVGHQLPRARNQDKHSVCKGPIPIAIVQILMVGVVLIREKCSLVFVEKSDALVHKLPLHIQ